MKTRIKHLFLLPALAAGLGLMPAGRVTAQTITNLHSFTGSPDGELPLGGLMLSGSTLYGTAQQGGMNGYGMMFAVNTDGSVYTNLHNFNGGTNDGKYPVGQLILSGNKLYGTAANGGTNDVGIVFAVNTNGTSFTNLHSFGSSGDGANPYFGRLILSGNTLYGTTYQGGSNNNGTVFAVTTDGSVYTNLHRFNGNPIDGAAPQSGLILSGSTLYGTTKFGGTNIGGYGTVFAVNTDGLSFTNLHSFNGSSDGAYPFCQLILSGNTLYGAASGGTSNFNGMVFAINTDGSGYTNLYTFSALSNNTNSDGAAPQSLILSGSTLYGVTPQGGTSGYGTVFAVSTNGLGFTNLYNFSALNSNTNAYGATPFDRSGLIFSGNTLYGTASQGGTNGNGTVFALTLPSAIPSLVLTNIIVSPANQFIAVSSNQQFTATGYFSDGSFQILTNGSGGTNLLWSSSSTNVATINTNGVATGLTNGMTTITATSGGVSGNASLTVVAPPVILIQPTNNTVSPNGSVTLNVSATGGILGYQWQFNGTNIAAATGASLTISNVSAANIGVYDVIVYNVANQVTSTSVTLASVGIEMFAGVIVDGPLGSNYLIQSRGNVASTNWTTLTNVALPTQPYIYIDYNSPTNSQQFYHAVPQ